MSAVVPSLRTVIKDHLAKFAAKAHTTFNGEQVTRVKLVNPQGPRGRWGVDVDMTDATGDTHRLAVSVVEITGDVLPDPVQALAKVIKGSMAFEDDQNSIRCRMAADITMRYADLMAQHPEFDRDAFIEACKPEWMQS
ncbi:hypothetical protein ACPCSE_29230 [Streptomyces cellulosae]